MSPPAVIPSIVGGDADDDTAPVFPAEHSAQRHASSSLAPPPRPPPSRLMPSGMSSLRVPPASNMTRLDVPAARRKVVLEPGYSPLDWARLKTTTDLRVRPLCYAYTQGGVSSLLRVTPSELKKHNKPDDAWSSIQGKVYNLTPYLKFHPGGVDTLMRIAGRDGTRLFCTYIFSPQTHH